MALFRSRTDESAESHEQSSDDNSLTRRILRAWAPVLVPLAVMWVLQIINAVTGYALSNAAGIQPRSLEGLVGIVAAPVLHFSFSHLLSNTVPWIILGTLLAVITRKYGQVTLQIWLISGVITWLIGGSNSVHTGASGVIYGYAAFLMIYGILVRKFWAMLISVITIIGYAGLVWGLFPQAGVSWQGHLGGVIAGIVAALTLTKDIRAERKALKEAKQARRIVS
ncbi:rhomboid family intramembrane serine protease [Auritidibacter ignavus]|uniref:rhomboid family intramembrane serine protease n=1 Tax=Auritidibacter ignavus TaxID=678932 RepID=UPI0024B8F550|nr:rhomboid family intramembrane serine protease [Auritidibacter ignavus]WHS27345.1 rhomboid family intramembrane serine protease [Auritidibacter ignavus]